MRNAPQTTVGPWAKEKLDALGQYLNFYTTALKNQGRWLLGTIFVDAFAGPGLARVRTAPSSPASPSLFGSDAEPDTEEAEFVKGSPRVALEIINPFSSYLFIERDPQRVAELQALKAEYPSGPHITIYEGDANAGLQAWLASGIDWRHHRAVVFLDPFGMQVPWSTIEALARTKAIEVLINFPLGMAIQRLMTRSGEIPVGWQISLDTFFGAPDWRNLAYEQEAGLFGQEVRKVSDSGIKLLEWYRGRLRSVFGNVSTARLIKNTRGNPLYYLIWAGPHALALKGAEHILSKGERLTGGGGRRRRSWPSAAPCLQLHSAYPRCVLKNAVASFQRSWAGPSL
jgi:three-Cys-motif partner protein